MKVEGFDVRSEDANHKGRVTVETLSTRTPPDRRGIDSRPHLYRPRLWGLSYPEVEEGGAPTGSVSTCVPEVYL